MTALEKKVKKWPAEKREQYEKDRRNYQILNEIRISLNRQLDIKLPEIRRRISNNHESPLGKLAQEYDVLIKSKIALQPRYREAWKKLIAYYHH